MKAEERKQQILEAAMACFTREGFHQTSIDDIARQADVSPALIYRHFRSKDDLIEAMATRNTVHRQWFLYELMQFPSIEESLEFFFEVTLQRPDWTESVPLLAQISAEAFRNPKIARILREDNAFFFGALTHLIRRAQSRGQVDPTLPPEESAYMLISFTNGLMAQVALDDAWDRLTNAGFKQAFTRMFTCYLGLYQVKYKMEENS